MNMEKTKQCFRCKEVKPRSEFQLRTRSKDGLNASCSECERIRLRKIYHRDPKDWMGKRVAKKEQVKGRNKVNWKGLRKDGFDAHHWSYNDNDLTDVIYLTKSEHVILHKSLKYCEDTFYFKTLDGVLLDTKYKHTEYISKFKVELYSSKKAPGNAGH